MTPLTLTAMLLFVADLSILGLVLWNAIGWPKTRKARNRCRDSCSVLIPARNEEDNLESCLESVLQQGKAVLEIIIYDDHSTDQTAAIVQRFHKVDQRIRLAATRKLPAGWCGKTFACAMLAEEAAGRWLLFIDADVRLSEMAVERMLHETEKRKVSFLSCWPGLELKGFWEKALMPMLNFVVLTLFPAPLSLKRQDASLGLAHGACILARGDEYLRIGGHGAVRDEIFEDTSLARIWRARGGRGICLDGQDIVRVRMYDSFQGIWSGFKKNFYPAFRRAKGFWMFWFLHLFCFFLPFALLMAPFQETVLWMTGLAAAAVLLMRTSLAVRFGHPLWCVLLHPPAELVLLILGLVSWRSFRGTRGVEWKGRIYRSGGEKRGDVLHESE